MVIGKKNAGVDQRVIWSTYFIMSEETQEQVAAEVMPQQAAVPSYEELQAKLAELEAAAKPVEPRGMQVDLKAALEGETPAEAGFISQANVN